MYTIAFSPRTDEELVINDLAGTDYATLKLKRDKTRLLHEDICQLAEDNIDKLTNRFGYAPLNCYVKLKDEGGWQLICNLKLTIRK